MTYSQGHGLGNFILKFTEKVFKISYILNPLIDLTKFCLMIEIGPNFIHPHPLVMTCRSSSLTKMFDKRDNFAFDIVKVPFLDGDVPRSTIYGVYISQLIRFAGVSSHVDDLILVIKF